MIVSFFLRFLSSLTELKIWIYKSKVFEFFLIYCTYNSRICRCKLRFFFGEIRVKIVDITFGFLNKKKISKDKPEGEEEKSKNSETKRNTVTKFLFDKCDKMEIKIFYSKRLLLKPYKKNLQ